MTGLLKLDTRLTLKHRQMLVVVGIAAAILLLASTAFFINDYLGLKAGIRDNLRERASFLAANSTAALVFDDRRAARQILEMAGVDTSVLAVVLYDERRRPVYRYTRAGHVPAGPRSFPPPGMHFEDGMVTVLEPVRFQGEVRGWLHMTYGLEALDGKVAGYLKVGLAIFAAGLLLAWLMAGYAQRFITEPIVQLAMLVDRIGRSKNYRERMHVTRGDELGVLIRGFNNMLEVIGEREAQLQRHGERLENLVELRTQQLRHRANYDALTRLPNRYLLMEKLHHSIENARRHRRNMALLLIDLDRFKIINDSLGHHVGDELLQAIARRLSSLGRLDDTVGRLGGDEFVILLENVAQPGDAELTAKKVLRELAEPFVLQHHRLHISASIGISIFPKDADDSVGLLRRADVSMYRSKLQGQSAYSFYDRAMDNSDERLALESRLRNALANKELYLVYQPQVCLKSNTVCGVEALMRWNNADLGEVLPADFVPVAVEIGLINDLTCWAVERVCRQQRRWKEQGVRAVKTAINISAADLLMIDFVQAVRTSIEKYGIEPGQIELEITEDVFLDGTDQIVNALRELKAMGLGIAIDDFGTGYSSLSYLRDFPVDVLKLDGSFVERIHESEKSRGIVASAISLAHGLSVKIVAECVETRVQYEYLSGRGCDIVQGNYFSAPLTGDALAIFLSQHRGLEDQEQVTRDKGQGAVCAQRRPGF